jgi:TP901 family phage tail tape measure protein
MASNSLIIKVGLKGAKTVVSGLKGITRGIGRASGSALKFATSWKTALVGITAIGGALKSASKFADGLREIQTIGGQTETELKSLGKQLRLVSGEFGQKIGDTTKAQYDIISAGISGSVRQMETLRASSKLAVAGVSDIGTTADVITSAMNAYGQANLSASHASDVLFKTVEKGKTTIPELGASLGMVMPFASSAGMSLEMVGASMAQITKGGVSTAEATTALKGAIVALDTPTKGAQAEMKKLGFEISRTAEGNLDFEATMEDLAKLDSKTISKFVPNVRGQLAVKSITKDMVDFGATVKSFNGIAGVTDKAVAKVNLSLGQQSRMLRENLKSGMIELGTEIGNKFLPAIGLINKKLQAVGKIGWGVVGKRIVDNMGAIWSAMVETSGVMIGRLADILPYHLWESLKLMWDMIKKVGVFLWEPIAKGWKLIWLGIKMGIVGSINWIIEQTNSLSEMMNKLPGVNIGMIQKISTTYGEEINKLSNETSRFEEMFSAGADSSESASEKIKEIWQSLSNTIFELNDEQKQSSEETADKYVDDQNKKKSAVSVLKDQIDSVAESENRSYQTTLSGVRSSIKAFLAQSIAKMISAESSKGIFGIATATAGAIAISALFDKMVPKFAKGGSFITDRPQMFMAGDNPGARERVTVEPLSSPGFQSSGKNITVNISAPLVDETVRDSIMPSIQNALSMELA